MANTGSFMPGPSPYGLERRTAPSAEGLATHIAARIIRSANTVVKHRAPDDFDRRLEETCRQLKRAGNIDCDGCFLRAGFFTWLAYFLAEKNNAITGDDILRLTPEAVASDISKEQPPENLRKLSQHILWESKRSATRRYRLTSAGISFPDNESAHHELSRPPKRPREDSESTRAGTPMIQHLMAARNNDGSQSDLPRNSNVFTHGITGLGTAPSLLLASADLAGNSGSNSACSKHFTFDVLHEYACPPAKNLPLVFPHNLCYAIDRDEEDEHAVVMLSFPADPAQSCLYFDIIPSQVQVLVKDLYGVQMDTLGNQRCVVHPSGAIQTIDGAVEYRYVVPDLVKKAFGDYFDLVLNSSEPRLREANRGLPLTDCLRFKIPGDAQSSSRFKLYTSVEQLTFIFQKLWQD
ncbi:hypothetical protein F4778DRAFT_729056 [Xylariomycetidae sp. FL2044]|nr:hypothetical protein F4778DRAFT_729056 [Xylariomycetidae sp. FL2044]